MAAGEIASAVFAAGFFAAIAAAGWTIVRLLGSERRREKKELRKVEKMAQRIDDLEERLKRQKEASREQQDQYGR